MRTVPLLLSCLFFLGCPAEAVFFVPPTDRLYFPTGIVYLESTKKPQGVLVVANANFDKRYSTGSVVAIDLEKLEGMPPFGSPVTAVAQVTDLKISPQAMVQVGSFTGQMAGYWLGGDRARLFVPSRSEGMQVQAIDVDFSAADVTVACGGPTSEGDGRNCQTLAPSLTKYELSETGLPRAPGPFGVAARVRTCATAAECGEGRTCVGGTCQTASSEAFADVWVSHISQADSPLASGANQRGYLVRFDSDTVAIPEENFINLGPGAGSAIAPGRRWTYVSGRVTAPAPNLIRLVERSGFVWSTGLEETIRVPDTRGLALSQDEHRLYVAARGPDALLVFSIDDPVADVPLLRPARIVQLPGGANEVTVIARPGRGNLVAVTCTGDGSLVLYDEDVGDLVAQVSGVGLQPFGLAVVRQGNGVRMFVTNFSDGRISVVDVVDLQRPQEARIVGFLGQQQLCLTRGAGAPGCGAGEGQQ